jgi:DNA repair exonuclease SbcCD nuclease subunit
MPRQEDGKIAHAPFRAEQLDQAGLDHALVGHFHRPADEPRYTYPGNPDPLSFGEDGQRAAVLVELADDGTVTRTRFPVATSLVHDRAVEVSRARHSGDVIDRVRETLHGLNGVARVTLSGEIDPAVDVNGNEIARRLRTPDLAVMVRIGALWPAYDIEKLAEEPTARGQFVRDVQAAEALDQDERRRVLMTGLRALDERDDLEVW